MALYQKLDVKNDFAYMLQFFSLISDGLCSVRGMAHLAIEKKPQQTICGFLVKNGLAKTNILFKVDKTPHPFNY